jgi:hypothetical protein
MADLLQNGVSRTFSTGSYEYLVLLIEAELSVQEGTGPQPNLVNLNDTDLHREEPWLDLRGLDIYDSNDDQIGS